MFSIIAIRHAFSAAELSSPIGSSSSTRTPLCRLIRVGARRTGSEPVSPSAFHLNGPGRFLQGQMQQGFAPTADLQSETSVPKGAVCVLRWTFRAHTLFGRGSARNALSPVGPICNGTTEQRRCRHVTPRPEPYLSHSWIPAITGPSATGTYFSATMASQGSLR